MEEPEKSVEPTSTETATKDVSAPPATSDDPVAVQPKDVSQEPLPQIGEKPNAVPNATSEETSTSTKDKEGDAQTGSTSDVVEVQDDPPSTTSQLNTTTPPDDVAMSEDVATPIATETSEKDKVTEVTAESRPDVPTTTTPVSEPPSASPAVITEQPIAPIPSTSTATIEAPLAISPSTPTPTTVPAPEATTVPEETGPDPDLAATAAAALAALDEDQQAAVMAALAQLQAGGKPLDLGSLDLSSLGIELPDAGDDGQMDVNVPSGEESSNMVNQNGSGPSQSSMNLPLSTPNRGNSPINPLSAKSKGKQRALTGDEDENTDDPDDDPNVGVGGGHVKRRLSVGAPPGETAKERKERKGRNRLQL